MVQCWSYAGRVPRLSLWTMETPGSSLRYCHSRYASVPLVFATEPFDQVDILHHAVYSLHRCFCLVFPEHRLFNIYVGWWWSGHDRLVPGWRVSCWIWGLCGEDTASTSSVINQIWTVVIVWLAVKFLTIVKNLTIFGGWFFAGFKMAPWCEEWAGEHTL